PEGAPEGATPGPDSKPADCPLSALLFAPLNERLHGTQHRNPDQGDRHLPGAVAQTHHRSRNNRARRKGPPEILPPLRILDTVYLFFLCHAQEPIRTAGYDLIDPFQLRRWRQRTAPVSGNDARDRTARFAAFGRRMLGDALGDARERSAQDNLQILAQPAPIGAHSPKQRALMLAMIGSKHFRSGIQSA